MKLIDKFLCALFIFLAYCTAIMYAQSAKAEFNGEKWALQLTMNWRFHDSCPDYVLEVSQWWHANYNPVPNRYNGLLPIDPTWAIDGQTIIYCSNEEPAPQAVLLDDPDDRIGESFTVAGKARWVYNINTLRIRECDIWIRLDTLNPLSVYRFVPHEWTHCLGIKHDNNPGALMYFAPTVTYPTIWDMTEVARLYELCQNFADRDANKYIARLDVSEWLKMQPELVQQEYADFANAPASYIQPSGTVWPDGIQRAQVSVCTEQ